MSDNQSGRTTAGVATFLEMFRVQPGVPYERAIEEISVLVGCTRDLSDQFTGEANPAAITALHYLSALAKALLNDLEVSRNAGV
ncbi:TPA: DUF3077 domain-containing protein [Pseudomonas putida]|nr:DUF3077 domain-containing protein [Pseudomonas putida]